MKAGRAGSTVGVQLCRLLHLVDLDFAHRAEVVTENDRVASGSRHIAEILSVCGAPDALLNAGPVME
jgi:hypothetical protein